MGSAYTGPNKVVQDVVSIGPMARRNFGKTNGNQSLNNDEPMVMSERRTISDPSEFDRKVAEARFEEERKTDRKIEPSFEEPIEEDFRPANQVNSDVEKKKHQVFGRLAALTIEESVKRNSEGKQAHDRHRLLIEGAPKHNGTVDWSRKIQFQLTNTELPVFCCVMLGMISEFRFNFHANKSLLVGRREDGGVVIMVTEGSNAHTVGMSPGDSFIVGALALGQLSKMDLCPTDLLLAQLKSTAMLVTANQAHLARSAKN